MLEISKNTYIYFNQTWKRLKFSEFDLNLGANATNNLKFSYSFDNKSFIEYKNIEDINYAIEYGDIDIFCSILVIPKNNETLIINNIKYQNKKISPDKIKYKTIEDIYHESTNWNLYDNNRILVENWKRQCMSIATLAGIPAIYFRTEPSETHNTLKVHNIRNVIDVKKIFVNLPNGEVPQDRNIYTDWDMPLQDDFMVHIVIDIFTLAFGNNKIPNEKDFIFFPIFNKIFRVSTMQPSNKFMGQVGWWEVYLSKYEEDETVKLDKGLLPQNNNDLIDLLGNNSIQISEDFSKESLTDTDYEFDGIDIDNWDKLPETKNESIDTVKNFIKTSIDSQEKIEFKTIEEKKLANQNYSNVDMDSTWCVSLKETEALREFYDKRLQIVSVNPDTNAFPINMYDCSNIDKRVVALTYNLKAYVTKNKFSTTIANGYLFNFNYILGNNFSGEIFNFQTKNKATLLVLSMERNQMFLRDIIKQQDWKIQYKFEKNELYQISLEYFNIEKYLFKIYKLEKYDKVQVFSEEFRFEKSIFDSGINIEIEKLYLFGGLQYVNDITLIINGNKILTDNCRPILVMNQFAL